VVDEVTEPIVGGVVSTIMFFDEKLSLGRVRAADLVFPVSTRVAPLPRVKPVALRYALFCPAATV